MSNKKSLSDLVKPQTRPEASELVYATAKKYTHTVKVFEPYRPIETLKVGMEHSLSLEKQKALRNKGNETDLERSLRRSKSKVSDYIRCNDFTHFGSHTFADNRYDIDSCRSRMSKWLDNQQYRNGKFSYLIVPEFHKDGKALHFHSLFKDYTGELVEATDYHTGKPLIDNGRPVYNFKSYTLGLNSVKHIDPSPESIGKVANYMTKYITKDMPVFPGKKRYWSSRDLNIPDIIRNPDVKFKDATPLWIKPTESGKVSIYSRDEFEKATNG